MTTDTPDGDLSRRRFLQIAGVTTGVGATTGVASKAGYSPVGNAEAIAPVVIGGAIVAGAAIGYLTGEAVDHYLGDEGDLDGTEETADLHAGLYTRVGELRAANDTILAQLENRLNDAMNVAWPKAKKEAVNQMNNGATEADAAIAAKAEIDAYYSLIQKNLCNRFTEITLSIKDIVDLHAGDANLSVMRWYWEDSTDSGTFGPGVTTPDITTTFEDGTSWTLKEPFLGTKSWTYDGLSTSSIDVYWSMTAMDNWRRPNLRLQIDPPDTGAKNEINVQERYDALWNDIKSQATTMRSNVDTYCTDLYANYTAGDIDPSQFLDPVTLASELSTDYGSTGYHAYAAAEAAMLGTPGTDSHSMLIDLVSAGVTVEGSVWTDWEPEGAGNPMLVGVTYDPANTAKEVYLSYEYDGASYLDGSDIWNLDANGNYVKETGTFETQEDFDAVFVDGETFQTGFTTLEERFTIIEATDLATGNSVDTVALESKNYQTSDVTMTEEQMKAINSYRDALRANGDNWSPFEALDDATGGGGALLGDGFLSFLDLGPIPGSVVGVGAAAAGALALGGSGGAGGLGGSGGSGRRGK